MTRSIARFLAASTAFLLAGVAFSACASGNSRSGTYTRLLITGEEILGDGYGTAYEALTHHRHLIVFEDRIEFEGGDDRSGLGSQQKHYTVPLLVVNGDYNLNDTITTLRGIPAENIIAIRLYYTSMVPPDLRRPGAEGGVIAVDTR